MRSRNLGVLGRTLGAYWWAVLRVRRRRRGAEFGRVVVEARPLSRNKREKKGFSLVIK
jgi:hypothetical protein